MSATGNLALVGGTIYPGPQEDAIKDGVILIRDGHIDAVGPRAAIPLTQDTPAVDCAGLTITAGFWNSHVHFFERKWANAATIPASELGRQLQDMLTRHGFTSAFDLSSAWLNTCAIRDRIECGEVPGPRIRTTGEGLVPPGALPSETVLHMMGAMNIPIPEVATAEEAAAAARELLNKGVDAVKIFASSPRSKPVPEDVIQAASNEAHGAGKLLFVHPNNGADVLKSVRGGADIIGHTTPSSGPWDETIIAAMKERGVALTPTLWIWKYYARHDRASIQDQTAATGIGQLRVWLSAGGDVLFGNDLGAVDYDPSEEYLMMAEAGMSFRQILAALTTNPAQRFGEANQLGRIRSGFRGDLVALAGDPFQNLRALIDVRYTIRDGRIIYRAR